MRPASGATSASCCCAGPRGRTRTSGNSSCSPLPRRRSPFPLSHVDVRVLPAAHAGTWWEQTALRTAAGRETLDAFFAPAYTAPRGLRVPLALTIHDVSFLAHPEWFRPRERIRRRWLTRRSARSAAVVFTDSTFSRDEILRHIPLDPARIEVIAPGVSPRHSTRRTIGSAGPAGALRRLGVQPPPPAAAHRGVRARHGRSAESAPGDRRREPHLAAPGSRVGRDRARRRRTGRGSQLRRRGEAGRPLQPGIAIRVPVRVRRLRVDAAGSARRGSPRFSCSIRRWLARSTVPRRPTCLSPQT